MAKGSNILDPEAGLKFCIEDDKIVSYEELFGVYVKEMMEVEF
jgi:hypothetical protein